MHPPLFKPHPLCQDQIKALVTCHEQNKVLKFLGVCNTPKAELDACFRREKQARRAINAQRATKSRAGDWAAVLAAETGEQPGKPGQ